MARMVNPAIANGKLDIAACLVSGMIYSGTNKSNTLELLQFGRLHNLDTQRRWKCQFKLG